MCVYVCVCVIHYVVSLFGAEITHTADRTQYQCHVGFIVRKDVGYDWGLEIYFTKSVETVHSTVPD